MSWLFALGDQSIGALVSVLLMNIQGWFPLGLTDLISLLSKGLSRVFSSTTLSKHQFFSTQPSLWSNSHIRTWLLVALTIGAFVGNVMSLLFNTLCVCVCVCVCVYIHTHRQQITYKDLQYSIGNSTQHCNCIYRKLSEEEYIYLYVETGDCTLKTN